MSLQERVSRVDQCREYFGRGRIIMIEARTVSGIQSRDPRTLMKNWTYSIQLNGWFLKPIGAWPLSLSSTTTDKTISVALTISSCFLIGFLMLSCFLCTALDNEVDLNTKVKMIGTFSFCLMAAAKFYILVSRGADIDGHFEHVRTDWEMCAHSVEDHEIMIDNAKFGRFLVAFCAVFMYSGGLFYTAVMPLSGKNVVIIDNVTVRSPAFPIYRGLIDPRTSPSIEMVLLIQFLAGFVMYSVTISACSLAAVFVMHACGQFKIIISRLQNLVSVCRRNGEATVTEGRLGRIVECHLRVLSFISRVEELLNEICLVELVGCMLNICFLGYNLIMEWELNATMSSVTYFSLLISFTFNIFILCYIGEILTEQCKSIGISSYMIEWYQLPGKNALGLILIIAMSNSSVKLTAGKFVELSLASFCSVIKSSLAYLSLLRTLTY